MIAVAIVAVVTVPAIVHWRGPKLFPSLLASFKGMWKKKAKRGLKPEDTDDGFSLEQRT